MGITLRKADLADRDACGELFRRYIEEMLVYTDEQSPTADQLHGYIELLTTYWDAGDHYPFVILCDEELAGFALVRRYPPDPGVYDMGQFFVSDRFKGRGVGRQAFLLTLAHFPGKWLTRVMLRNERALSFWQNVIAGYTGGDYSLARELEQQQEMHFLRFEA